MNQDCSNLLGADISEASFLGEMQKMEASDFDMYHVFDSKTLFLDKYQSQFAIMTREDDTIREISLYMPPVMNKDTLVNEMAEIYGEGKIMVVDEITHDGPSKVLKGKFSMTAKETRMTLKEGTMEDDVVQVIWEIEDVQIILHMKHLKGVLSVRFTKDAYNANR